MKATDNIPIRIHVNKIGHRITFKIKAGYYLELIMSETIKLLGSTKNKITKDENCENNLHLEITEVALIHCKFVNNNHQNNSKLCKHLFQINRFVSH